MPRQDRSQNKITVGKDGLDLGLVPLLELDDGSSCECGQHGGRQLVRSVRLTQLSVHQGLSGPPCYEKLPVVGVASS